MEALYRFFSGAASSLCALMAPVGPMILCTLLFTGVDFVTGVAADRAETRRAGRRWFFESRKAWRTVTKAALASTAIVMAWLLECCVVRDPDWHLARMFAGFICGVELWSFLENAALASSSPLFGALRRHLRRSVGGEVDR